MALPIEIYRSEHQKINFEVTNPQNEARDLSGDVEVWFYVSDQLPANVLHIEKECVITDAKDGLVEIELDEEETDLATGLYYYSVIVIYPNGNNYNGGIGRFFVKKVI